MKDDNFIKIVKIRVWKLFGKFNHEVSLRTNDRVTIIHGPNGVGKTVFLRLISSMFPRIPNLPYNFDKYPFEKFEITLSNNEVIGFQKNNNEKEKKASGYWYHRKINSEEQKDNFSPSRGYRDLALALEENIPFVELIDEDRFIDRRINQIFTGEQLVLRYSEQIPEDVRKNVKQSVPSWFSDIQAKVNIHFIEAQRLLRTVPSHPQRMLRNLQSSRTTSDFIESVNSCADDLRKKILENLTNYAKKSQILDQSFPQRLLEKGARSLSINNLKKKMQELENKRQQLKRAGLLAEDNSMIQFDINVLDKLDETKMAAMTLYVEDTESKFGVLDELNKRIEILLNNINKKFSDKSIMTDRDNGLSVKTYNQKNLNLNLLSSGEQQEIVLLYDLLFEVKQNTLVLIDEPELSLHVNWQKAFLPDLLEIVKAANFDVLIATHSPFIVGENHELLTPMKFVEDYAR